MTNLQNRFWWRIILAMCIGVIFAYCIFWISREQPRLENYLCGALLFGFIYWSALTPREAGTIGVLKCVGNEMGRNLATMVIVALSLAIFCVSGMALFGFAGEQLGGERGAISGCIIGIVLGLPFAIWTAERLKDNFVDKGFNESDQRSISKEMLRLKKKFPWILPVLHISFFFLTYNEFVNELEIEIFWHKILLFIFWLVFYIAVLHWYSVEH